MATHWKKQLADAHHEARKLKNRIHELEQELKDALAAGRASRVAESDALLQAAELAQERARLTQATPAHRPLSDFETSILAGCLLMEVLPMTPARRRLIDRLSEAILGKEPA